MMQALTIRAATQADRPRVRQAVIELQEYERRQSTTRLPGEQIVDPYLAWLWQQADRAGALLVAEIDGRFAGFAAGWVEEARYIAETADSSRFGLLSDIFVVPEFRGHRIATRLIQAMERDLGKSGVTRLRINALASNVSARRSYEHAGLAPYEVLHEKMIDVRDHG
jgi:GNAT superfamily N-acetyltransferase